MSDTKSGYRDVLRRLEDGTLLAYSNYSAVFRDKIWTYITYRRHSLRFSSRQADTTRVDPV